jgi:hypothetical protein
MSTTTIDAYPLCWPDGWPRKQSWQRNSSTYRVTFATARDSLVRELRLAHARDIVVSSNVPVRRDGLPLAGMSEPRDPGVAVYWTDTKRRPRVIACDVWRTVRENVRAVGLAVEHIRGLERTGASEILERAFSGFALLPPGGDHWTTLGLERGACADAIKRRHRDLALANHPDHVGGDGAAMARINAATQDALREVGAL